MTNYSDGFEDYPIRGMHLSQLWRHTFTALSMMDWKPWKWSSADADVCVDLRSAWWMAGLAIELSAQMSNEE